MSLQKRTKDTIPAKTKPNQKMPDHLWPITSLPETSVLMKYVYLCLTKRKRKKKTESTMVYDVACVYASECVYVCLSEKVLQWRIYDTPFTSGGASCLSFFIPRSLMGL